MLTSNYINSLSPLTSSPKLTLSIVSHAQADLVRPLLLELAALPHRDFEIILTINVPEDERPLAINALSMMVIRNISPRGFGANHNAAFSASRAPFFAVVNPDIRLGKTDPSSLLEGFADPYTAACAPFITNRLGERQDTARRFPTWINLTRKAFCRHIKPDYVEAEKPLAVDWVAGMLVVFRRDAYLDVGGFDDRRYFMYYEDADICLRLSKRGWRIILVPSVKVLHEAQRASHRNLRHMRWHATSMFRFLTGF